MLNYIKKRKKELEIGFVGLFASMMLYVFLRYLIAPIIRRVWVHSVEGLENIPTRGPIIIASNHESYLDFLCFWAISPRKVQYLAAEVFYKSKFWRPIMIATGQIKVDRQNKDKEKAKEQAHYILMNKGVLGVFPEGTRTRSGEMGKAYIGVTRIAIKAQVPIVPVGIIGTYEAWPAHRKLPRFKKCKIKIDKPIIHHEHFDKEHVEESLLRHLTDELMLVISNLTGKEYKHHYKLQKSNND
jgi:1-acyl-sn-glycerol-3-phosphate acyltransferase